MRGPKPPMIELTSSERHELNSLLRRHSTPQQLALRARVVDGLNNGQIVRSRLPCLARRTQRSLHTSIYLVGTLYNFCSYHASLLSELNKV